MGIVHWVMERLSEPSSYAAVAGGISDYRWCCGWRPWDRPAGKRDDLMIRLYALIIVIGLVGGAISGGYYYYVESQSRIQALIENTAKLTIAKKLQDETINSMVADQKKFAKLNTDLRGRLDKANDYKDVLIGKLRKNDLSRLSLKKPLLVEKRINAASAKLFKSLEVMSGATPPVK